VSVTQLLLEISTPDVTALHEVNAVAPDIAESFDVLTFISTDVLVGTVAEYVSIPQLEPWPVSKIDEVIDPFV
jgi:hypothetical protein